jgi:hypothetical protein
LKATAAVSLNELSRRILVEFAEPAGNEVVRGQTSVAVSTP